MAKQIKESSLSIRQLIMAGYLVFRDWSFMPMVNAMRFDEGPEVGYVALISDFRRLQHEFVPIGTMGLPDDIDGYLLRLAWRCLAYF